MKLRIIASEDGASADVNLTDAQWAAVQVYCAKHQVTLDEWFGEIVAHAARPDNLARALVGRRVKFRHQRAEATSHLVTSASEAGLVTLEGWSAEFAPDLFVVVEP